MLRFILTRVSLVIPTFLGITMLAFFLIRLVPGDPIETLAGERGIDPERLEQLRTEYGFDGRSSSSTASISRASCMGISASR